MTGAELRKAAAPPSPQYTDGIVASTRTVGAWTVTTYALPVDQGFVHHIGPASDALLDQVETIFAGFQAQDAGVPFRRNELKAHKLGSRMLAQSFAFVRPTPLRCEGEG